MTFRPWLERPVLGQMTGLPSEAFDIFTRTLARICNDPYDRLCSMPTGEDPRERMAELGDSGFIIFAVDDDAGLVRVYDLVLGRLTGTGAGRQRLGSAGAAGTPGRPAGVKFRLGAWSRNFTVSSRIAGGGSCALGPDDGLRLAAGRAAAGPRAGPRLAGRL